MEKTVVGVVCEYNPFHKGHQYHLQTIKKLTDNAPIICVMSGHYVQRAEPALLDKWTRTRMALAAGASLVIELPTYYSTATAEHFALGAIRLLQATGLVNALSFGMEKPDLMPGLEQLAAQLEPETPAYQALLSEHLKTSSSFARARLKALQHFCPIPEENLQAPGAILILEYLKALRRLSFCPDLLPIQRVSAGYHDTSTQASFPSATAIRRQAAKGCSIAPYLPDCCQPYVSASLLLPDRLFEALPYQLSRHTAESLRDIDEVAEGLENRILAANTDSPDYAELLSRLKTKRYPTSRLRRVLLNILLDIRRENKAALNFLQGPAYLRVLGFRKADENLLSALCKQASLPVITNLSQQYAELPPTAKRALNDELRFSRIYAQAHPDLLQDAELRMPLIVQK